MFVLFSFKITTETWRDLNHRSLTRRIMVPFILNVESGEVSSGSSSPTPMDETGVVAQGRVVVTVCDLQSFVSRRETTLSTKPLSPFLESLS